MADILTTLSARIDELAEQTKKLADSVSSAGSSMGSSMNAFDRALRQAEEETAKVGVKLKGLDSAFSSVGHGAKSFKELSDATGYSRTSSRPSSASSTPRATTSTASRARRGCRLTSFVSSAPPLMTSRALRLRSTSRFSAPRRLRGAPPPAERCGA